MSKFTTPYLVCPLSCGISPCSTSPAHWPHHVVDYGKSGILPHSAWRAVRSSWTLPDLRHIAVPDNPEDPKRALWETCLENRQATGGLWRVVSRNCMHILATYGWVLSCCIVVTSRRWSNGTSHHSAWQWHAPSGLVASVAFRRLTKLDILGWPAISQV